MRAEKKGDVGLHVTKSSGRIPAMFDLISYLKARGRVVDQALRKCLPRESERPQLLHKAMRYSVLAGGKRLRPILCLAAAETVKGSWKPALVPAVALECLHTYTLIHDDLPSMDNDDLRRGRPTLHKVYGEANAILAGDSLLTLAFELLANVSAPRPHKPNQLSLELARASGSRGVAGGQFEDLRAEGRPPNAKWLNYIHRQKTAALIRAACRMGAIAAGANRKILDALSAYGDLAGLAFQIADDILNTTSTPEQLGKATGNDAARKKMTYVSLYGVEKAQMRADELALRAADIARSLPHSGEVLAALAVFTTRRLS
jgi:geranylgeranyl diphosphate synthase type II